MPDQEPHRDENRSASPWFSPGLVHSDEIVLRTVLDPDHLKSDGGLKSAAIPLDDIQLRGWSLERRNFSSIRQVRLFHAAWQRRKPHLAFHVVPVIAKSIRKLASGHGSQTFVVTDTATFCKPAHAQVLLSKPQTPSLARKFRNELIHVLPPHVDVTEAFKSCGKWGYVRGMFAQLVAIPIEAFRCILRI